MFSNSALQFKQTHLNQPRLQQSQPFLSRRLGRGLVVGATLALPFSASAQPTPTEALPTGKVPPQGRFARPEPPAISTEELQLLTGGPTLINYSGTDVPANDVIKVFVDTAKTRTPFPVANNLLNEQQKISVSWKNTPFWKAASQVEELLDGRWSSEFRGGLRFQKNYLPAGQNAAGQNQGVEPGLNGLVGGQTPFVAICATSLTRTSVSKVFLGAGQGLVQNSPDRRDLMVTTYFDPKLSIRSVDLRDVKFQSKPNVVPIESPQHSFGVGIPNSNNIIAKSNLSIPDQVPADKNFSRISGVVRAVITVSTETWKVPDLAAADKVPTTIAGGEFTVESFTQRDSQIVLKLVVKTPPDQGMGYFVGSPFGNITVRDAQGNELRQGSSSSTGDGVRLNMEVRYNLRGVANEAANGPFSLEWPVPTQSRSYNVPFEFRDFPMP